MRIYADHAATTPVRDEVLQAMLPFFTSCFGNPSSLHQEGQEARKAVEQARKTIAGAIGAKKTEIVFTSGGSEANNLALRCARSSSRGKHIIVSSMEHASVLEAAKAMEKEEFELSILPADPYGHVRLQDLENMVNEETVLVSCQMVNHETGARMPVEEIGEFCRKRGILFHIDAVQALGKVTIDLGLIRADLVSLNAHKIYGPKGTGALYIREGTKIPSMIFGGPQEYSRRAGTENVPGIVGFARAAELAVAEQEESSRKIRRLEERLVTGLKDSIRDIHFHGSLAGAETAGHIPVPEVPGFINVRFDGIKAENLVMFADMHGLSVSAGSACHAGSEEPSNVLMALGLTRKEASEAVRITLGADNTQDEVDEMIRIFRFLAEKLRGLS